MTRLLTPKLGAYAALTAAGLLAALLFARAEAAVLALPFALVALLGMASVREPQLELEPQLDRDRVLEGEQAVLAVRLRAAVPVRRVELSLRLPAGLALADIGPWPELTLRAGEERTVELRIATGRWGAYNVGSMLVRTRDRFGLMRFERVLVRSLPLRVYPTPDRLRTMLAPLETHPLAGNAVSRERGDGIEFADVREFVSGDRVRQVNWRVSARRGDLHVNQHRPERNTDVVIFIDTFAEVGEGGDHARSRHPGGGQPCRPLPGNAGPGRADRLRRHHQVAAPGHGSGPALPVHGLPARHPGRRQLRMEGHRRDPDRDTSPQGVAAGADTADRRAHGRRPARRPRPRL